MKPNCISYDQWMKLDEAYIDDSDVILRIPGPSSGADKECKYALSQGKPVVIGLKNFLTVYKEDTT
jgi:hypothetical protein